MATKKGRCDDHQPIAWQSNEGKSRHERGYGSAWVKIRDRIRTRDNHLCQECLRSGIITQGKQVDHILNKARGGTDDDSNLELLCIKCHKIKTNKERLL